MKRIKKKRYERRSEPPLCSKSFVGRCGGGEGILEDSMPILNFGV